MSITINICKILIFISLIIYPTSFSGKDDKETDYNEFAGLKNADMVLYSLYQDNMRINKDLAMEYAVMFISRIDSSETNIEMAELYDDIADYYELDKFLYSKAIYYKEKALKQYSSLGKEYKTAICGYGLAKLYLKKGRFHLALQYAMEELAYFEKKPKCLNERMECYKLLGVIYETCGDYEESNRYLSEYTKLARNNNDSLRFLVGLNNSAVFANTLGDTTKTVKLLNECITLCKDMNDTIQMCKLYLNAAAANTETGDYKRASRYLDESFPLTVNIELKGHYWLNKGYMYLCLQDTTKAIEAYEHSISYYSQGEFDLILKELYQTMNLLYEDRGDTPKAYHYLRALYELENEAPETDIWRQLFKVQKEIQREKAEKEKERLKGKQNFMALCAISAVIISSLAIFVFYRKRKYEERQRLSDLKRHNEISEIKKTQQFRADKILENAISKLMQLAGETHNTALKNSILKICNELRESKDSESWKELEQFVPDFNSDFFQNLIKEFPSLSINESRICILLNKNMSTKQISEITRQNPESINVARARLRKKLGIDGQKISLQEFLRKFN